MWTSFQITAIFVLKKCYCSPGKVFNFVAKNCPFYPENLQPAWKIVGKLLISIWKIVNLVTKDCYFVTENYPFCQFFVTSRKFVNLVQRICWFRPSKLFGPGILLISSTIYCSFYHGKLITSPGKLLIFFRKIVYFSRKIVTFVVSWDLLRRIVADRRNTHGTIYYTWGRPVHDCSCAVQNTKAMT